MISVPSLVGMDVEEAEEEFGDDFRIETTAEVEDERPVGTIVTQDPEDGEARENSTISVEVVETRGADAPDGGGEGRGRAGECGRVSRGGETRGAAGPGAAGEGRNAAGNVLGGAGLEVSMDGRESSFGQ